MRIILINETKHALMLQQDLFFLVLVSLFNELIIMSNDK